MTLASLKGTLISLQFFMFGPIAQQNDDLNVYQRISRSFNQGPDPTPIYIGFIVLVIVLVLSYWVLRMYTDFLAPGEQKSEKVGILEAIRQNIKLSNKQEKYLRALIEKYQDKHPYDPEVKTEYLEKFLFYALQSLTHAPDRAIRRKTHYVPKFETEDELDVMFKTNDTHYATERCSVVEQDGDNVVIEMPEDIDSSEFREGRAVSTAFHKGDLTLWGEGEIKHLMEDKILLNFPEGMHFEEHRTYDRVEVHDMECDLILQEFEGEAVHLEGRFLDMSIGGARVKTRSVDERVHENIRGRLQFELEERELDIQVSLVYLDIDEDADTMEMGLQFLEPGLANRQHIHDFVERKKKS